MPAEPDITSMAHIIQLAMAPAFLLAGMGGILGVMTTRLARSIDRARLLEERHQSGDGVPAEIAEELKVLVRRTRLIGISIGLCTLSALLISAVIGVLFLSSLVTLPAAPVVAVMFICAMSVLVAALLIFLREIFLASSSLRIGMPRL